MHLHQVTVKNFRLLADVELILEKETTLIVGRNNSGKTSLSEVIRRFLVDSAPSFQVEDFASACYDAFCDALTAKNEGKAEDVIRAMLPAIELRLTFKYDPSLANFGPLGEFVIDLDPACDTALVVAEYALRDGSIKAFFDGQPTERMTEHTRTTFFRSLRVLIPSFFVTNVWAQDPNDPANRKPMTQTALRNLLRAGFINAQRGLDDTTTRESDVLARMLDALFTSAMSPTAGQTDQEIAAALQQAVVEIQKQIETGFSSKLKGLLPTFQTFGYPGLGGPDLATETTLDVKKLLANHTKVRYLGCSGVLLPESYNGLGVRNLLFILLQMVSFYRAFRADSRPPGLYLVFIEEPEAHLHPQMQEVFIRQISNLARQLSAQNEDELPWPVQFVISTHSSHVANAARFEAVRYFLPVETTKPPGVRVTRVKDLRAGLSATPRETKDFLHQYLTLTRCDLFFADKAILIEGTGERILLPIMIEKLEAAEPDLQKLSRQYVTILEVGGAYAHLFSPLLDFLQLRTLIITDIDSVVAPGGKACAVHQGTASSNACVNDWFRGADCTLAALLQKTDKEKVVELKRLAYQRPETAAGPCGRTLEDAFILANPVKFGVDAATPREMELKARDLADSLKKSEFALKHALADLEWVAPGYILDGLRWLARLDSLVDEPGAAPEVCAVTHSTATPTG